MATVAPRGTVGAITSVAIVSRGGWTLKSSGSSQVMNTAVRPARYARLDVIRGIHRARNASPFTGSTSPPARELPPSSVGSIVAKAGSRSRRSASASGPERMSLRSSTLRGSPTPTSQRAQSAAIAL